jgi:chromatin structure-remodeling complex subunit RSC9
MLICDRTLFDPEPKLNGRHIDLFRLYRRVIEEGGYDRASDTKGNALAWRRITGEFFPASSQITTLAFQVKTQYYKYLA